MRYTAHDMQYHRQRFEQQKKRRLEIARQNKIIKDAENGMKITNYVSYKEVTYSQTAIKNDLDNDPTTEQLKLIQETAMQIFDPLRRWVDGPVKINSVFRGDALNKKIGGSKTSQHCVGLDKSKRSYGSAFDVDDTFGHKTNREMFHWLKDNVVFDQLIYEFPDADDNNNARWIHFSYRNDGGNRQQMLIAHKINKLDKDGNVILKKNGKPAQKTKYSLYKGNEVLTQSKVA